MDPIVIDLYCRISRDYDGTLRSVEAQEAQGREWIARHAHEGYVLGEVFRDHALSGWNPKIVRPGFVALMDRLESGVSGGIWVRDLDRFTRKLDEAERLLKAAALGAIVVAGHSAYDLTTARGKKSFREDAVDAANESDRTSERVTRGKIGRAERGKTNASLRGFGRPGYLPNPEGWMPGDPRLPVPDEQLQREVRAVREAAAEILAGGTLMAIARAWNEEGLLTSTGYRWDGGLVRQMLVAPSIAGLVENKGEILSEGAQGPLDRETWDRLMLHLSSRKRGRPAVTYLLSGIVRCGRCGSVLYGRPLVSKPPYEDGEVQRQYWCQVRIKQQEGCGRLTMDQRFADEVVEALVVERLGDPRHADRVARVAARVEEERRAIAKELHDLNAEADEIASKTGKPGWTPSRVDAALANYAPRIEDAEARLKALGSVPADTAGASSVDAEADWAAADITQRRALVRRAFPQGLTILPATTRGPGSKSAARFQIGPPKVALVKRVTPADRVAV